LTHRLIDFTKVVFLRRPESRLWVLRAIRSLKTSLPRFRPNQFFQCHECWKLVRMLFRHQETSLQRNHLSRILRHSDGRLLDLKRIR
jgi:hypothetical protein